jgi:transcriptional regulator with XRE-family HTH domain
MDGIRDARSRLGLSQRNLARRAGLSFRGLQLLESPNHDPRVSSLDKVSQALGLPNGGISTLVGLYLHEDGRSFRCASLRMVTDGFDSWRLHLFDAVDAFRRSPERALLHSAPEEALDPRLRAIIASTVEALCDEVSSPTPAWCRGVVALDRPWFVSGLENLKASALVESPAWYRKRNVFVLSNFLTRA